MKPIITGLCFGLGFLLYQLISGKRDWQVAIGDTFQVTCCLCWYHYAVLNQGT